MANRLEYVPGYIWGWGVADAIGILDVLDDGTCNLATIFQAMGTDMDMPFFYLRCVFGEEPDFRPSDLEERGPCSSTVI